MISRETECCGLHQLRLSEDEFEYYADEGVKTKKRFIEQLLREVKAVERRHGVSHFLISTPEETELVKALPKLGFTELISFPPRGRTKRSRRQLTLWFRAR